MNAILLLNVDTSVASLVREHVASSHEVERASNVEALVDRLRREPLRYDAVVIGEEVVEPVRLLQKVASIRKDIPSIILCETEQVDALQRSMQFTPFLPTDLSIYVARPAEAAAEAIREAADQIRRRRRYASVIHASVPRPGGRSRTENDAAFLQAVLDTGRDAVILFDHSGHVRQWNARAEQLFGGRDGLHHRSMSDVVGDETAWALKHSEDIQPLLQLETVEGPVFANVSLRAVESNREIVGHVLTVTTVDARAGVAGEETELEMAHRALIEQASELRRMNDALKRSNRELEDFAYTASHDLQEPLRKINSFSDLLRSDFAETLGGDGAFYLDRLQDASSRMIELIRGLLEYSRVATNSSPPRKTDLNVIARRVLSDLEIAIDESGAIVEVQQLPSIEADPIQMRQLFQNLIGNALKFRREGVAPHIILSEDGSVASEPGMVVVAFADNGIGLDMRFADRIFAPFQRLHGRTKFEGSGMGLAICRRIVQRHEGQIEVKSEPGRGTTFHIHLPVRQSAREV